MTSDFFLRRHSEASSMDESTSLFPSITGADHLEFGQTLTMIAERITGEVRELCAQGEFPADAVVRVYVDAPDRRLDILIAGISPESDPDRVATKSALYSAFEVASHLNVVDVTNTVPPLFSARILAVDFSGEAYAGLIGAAVGDIHPAAASPSFMRL
jgi:hypothetical protein